MANVASGKAGAAQLPRHEAVARAVAAAAAAMGEDHDPGCILRQGEITLQRDRAYCDPDLALVD